MCVDFDIDNLSIDYTIVCFNKFYEDILFWVPRKEWGHDIEYLPVMYHDWQMWVKTSIELL